MNKKIYFAFILLSGLQAIAQVPEEALRLSWRTQQGTARNQAIGGAMVSLGGDATANIINPAGLAFFKTSDFILTPGVQMLKDKGSFRGINTTGLKQNNFALGTSGWVFGGLGYKNKNSFAITVTKLADFNKRVSYNGQNDYSSFAEPLANEFARSGLDINVPLGAANLSLPTKMAVYTYLIDIDTSVNPAQVIARSENTSLLNQEYLSETSGGITEITFGLGHELNKKWMIGGSLGIPIVKLNRDTYYRESDASGNIDNDFGYAAYRENYSLKGFGINFRGGLIYRPKEYLRFGLAIHSADLLVLKENFNSGMAVDVENYFGAGQGYDSVSSSKITGNSTEQYRYSTYTPTKIMLSGSYVFREVENVKRQKGFITADIEYLNYKWMNFGPYNPGETATQTKADFKPFNQAIDAVYKGAFNFKVGGELKFNILMARLGFAYYSSPYSDKSLKASRMNLSGGLGYRNKGMFVDLTYIHRLQKDVNFPYRLEAPRANTYANVNDNGGNVMLTVGFKI